MNGAKLRSRLQAGEAVTMYNTHHMSTGLAGRLIELGADSVFVDCEHGTWGFDDVRTTGQIVRGQAGLRSFAPFARAPSHHQIPQRWCRRHHGSNG